MSVTRSSLKHYTYTLVLYIDPMFIVQWVMLRRGHWWARKKAAMAKFNNNGVLFLESCQFFEKWKLPIPYTQISWNLGTAKCRRIHKTRSKQHYQPHQMHTKYGQQDGTESAWHFWSDLFAQLLSFGKFLVLIYFRFFDTWVEYLSY